MNPNDPAFIDVQFSDDGTFNLAMTKANIRFGLTKREYFAALAMQGLLSHPGTQATVDHVAQYSVQMADALIAELSKEKE